ncbi:hypothetical protein AB1E18_009868 [Capra hircus]
MTKIKIKFLLRVLHRALIILCTSQAMVLCFVSICGGNGSWPTTSCSDCGTSALAPTRLGCVSSETQVRPIVATLAVVVIVFFLGLLIVSQVCRDLPSLLLVLFALSFMGLLSFLTFSGASITHIDSIMHPWGLPTKV